LGIVPHVPQNDDEYDESDHQQSRLGLVLHLL
jgi:hypothetical protein